LKLLKSKTPAVRKKGLAGTRDDGEGTRLLVLEAVAAEESEDNRVVFQNAVIDRSPVVRAASLVGFGRLEKITEPQEIQNTFSDKNEIVLMRLAELAAAKKVVLPANVLQSLLDSKFASVKAAAAKIGS